LVILLILYHKNGNDADFFNNFFKIFHPKGKEVFTVANKTKKLFVRIVSGIMAGLLLLGCVAMLAII
jgi:hypothetical protein